MVARLNGRACQRKNHNSQRSTLEQLRIYIKLSFERTLNSTNACGLQPEIIDRVLDSENSTRLEIQEEKKECDRNNKTSAIKVDS
jgi:hypothetical protein